MENSMKFPQKIKNGTTISRNYTPEYLYEEYKNTNLGVPIVA